VSGHGAADGKFEATVRLGVMWRLIDLWPYALVAFLYFATWPFHHGLNNPNEMVRVYMTKALVDHGSPVIDPVIAVWGGVDDKAVREGKLYSSKAPLQSLIGVPAYLWSKLQSSSADKRLVTTELRRFGSVLPGALFAFALIAWSRRRSVAIGAGRRLGTALGLAIALGTMIYPYALTFTGHILAAATAGGAYLALVVLSLAPPNTWRWRALGAMFGFCAGAAPFAEYPAALMVVPALVAVLFVSAKAEVVVEEPELRRSLAFRVQQGRRFEIVLWTFLGGIGPFLLGLEAHLESWGSPFKTGYAFLENRAYVEVHKGGFFGVGPPKIESFLGALFSPGTGLFFYSPMLAVGLLALIVLSFRSRWRSTRQITLIGEHATPTSHLDRRLAWAALLGCILEFLFIAGHTGWRGGWTVGPRYIISVAPVLGMWTIESLASPLARRIVPGLAAASILITGTAAALYPHLSDVFTNPIGTFLWPSYAKGLTTYGIGHSLGLDGWAANLVHLVPLAIAIGYVAVSDAEPKSRRALVVSAARSVAIMIVIAIGILIIPERDPQAAQRENERLWGFWEPKAKPKPIPGFISRARDHWRSATVTALRTDGQIDPCVFRPESPDRCFYGPEPWHHFGPDHLEMKGVREPILFMHPIRDEIVRASLPLAPRTKKVILRYGMADASVASDNPTPIRISVKQGDGEIARAAATNIQGLHTLPITLTSTAPVSVEIRCERDGARVFGFDLEFYGE
jgi:hypothetical protein